MEIIVVGAGIGGLSTALLLAKDGHAVQVLERDSDVPPAAPPEAWDGWSRKGVNQFRMLHFFQPRFTEVLDQELPGLTDALVACGANRYGMLDAIPDFVTGGPRDGDERFTAVTGRRPVMEAALSAATAAAGIQVRRGAAVAELRTGQPCLPGVPHVTGVRLESGEELPADLVVDAGGRRSPMPRWLEAMDARPLDEEREDCGFIYYGRHFQSGDGSTPMPLSGLLQPYGSVSTLTLPADNGTWGVGVVTSARDSSLRALKDTETWMRTVRGFPLAAHWLDAEPIDDGIAVMAKIEDRHRDMVVDGTPVATGVVLVADSWACTNPSVGRGTSIGLLHAVALRDLVRSTDGSDPVALAEEWEALTNERVEPWYRATLSFDRHRLAESEAEMEGRPYETDDPGWLFTKALLAGASQDPDILRTFLRIVGVLDLPDVAVSDSGVLEKLMGIAADPPEPPPGPSRAELLALVAG